MTRPGVPPTSDARDIGAVVELMAKVVAPVSVAVALLCYFGYVRTTNVFTYFGVDVGTVGFATFDYLLRSPVVIFRPVALFLLGIIGGYWLYRGVDRLVVYPSVLRYLPQIAMLLVATGVIIAGFGAMSAFWSPLPSTKLSLTLILLLPPLMLGAGVLLAAFGVHLRHRWIACPVSARSSGTVIQRSAAAGLLVLAAFWAVGSYGALQGESTAEELATDLPNRSGVVVYSRDRLYLSGFGIQVAQLGLPDSAYHFRYSGLRLLARTSESYVLLPMGWTRRSGAPAFVIPEDAGIRVDYQALP